MAWCRRLQDAYVSLKVTLWVCPCIFLHKLHFGSACASFFTSYTLDLPVHLSSQVTLWICPCIFLHKLHFGSVLQISIMKHQYSYSTAILSNSDIEFLNPRDQLDCVMHSVDFYSSKKVRTVFHQLT